MKILRIGADRVIGPGRRVFVIAEIGVNHGGSVGRALDLVKFAHRAGADAVKLQFFQADRLLHDSASLAEYQRDRVKEQSAAEMLKKYELPAADVERVVALIRSNAMIPLATPFSFADVETIAKLELPAIKIASPDIVNRPLLEAAAKTRRPMLVSTGAATPEEIGLAVRWLNDAGVKFALLHCVSSYPTEVADVNLCWIAELAARYDVPVGFSDHTIEPMTGALAVASGATIVEKHLTYDRSADGPDHASSANPTEFARYVSAVRVAEAMRGQPGKQVLDCERDVRRLSRQSLVLTRDVSAGASIRQEDLTVQRPGTGVPAAEYVRVVGRKSKRTLSAGTMLQWDMLSDAA
jgi:N-acetylneuraminate synthase/N,N'-diacetyllegionaminate synthase